MDPGPEKKNAVKFITGQLKTLDYGLRIRQRYCINVKLPDFTIL